MTVESSPQFVMRMSGETLQAYLSMMGKFYTLVKPSSRKKLIGFLYPGTRLSLTTQEMQVLVGIVEGAQTLPELKGMLFFEEEHDTEVRVEVTQEITQENILESE